MDKIKDIIIKLKARWGKLSKAKKLSIKILLSSILLALVLYYLTIGKVKYVPIFTNLDINDSGTIVESLEEMNITNYKLEDEGTTILVPEKEVDRLRLDLAIDGVLPNDGKGFELFDDTGFAMTDSDRKILYQRALEGELQRSIMTLEEIDHARVHLAMSEETIFTKEIQPGTASVILKINSSNKLSQDKIRGITSLVSAAVNNLPEENVKVIDTEGTLLSEGIFEKDGSPHYAHSSNTRIEAEQEFENSLEQDLTKMLEQVLGIGNVIVKVSADLDFDSAESTTITYDEDGVIRSQQVYITGEGDYIGGVGQSPIDNNSQNYIDQNIENILQGEGLNAYSSTTNNEIGETTTHTIKAPGEVRRLTSSIVYNGNLSPETRLAIENMVQSATGFDAERGDLINVEGMIFDTSYQDKIQEELEREQALLEEQEAARRKLRLYVGIPLGIILAALLILLAVNFSRRKKKAEVPAVGIPLAEDLPMVEARPPEPLINIEAQETTEEKSIKNFAEKNPEKLAELVRAWIIEDER